MVLALQVAGAGLGYVMHVVLARVLSPGDYGAFAYAVAWATVMASALTLGLPGVTLRFVAEYVATARTALLASLWRWALCVTSAGLLGVFGLAAVGGLVLALIGYGTVWPFLALTCLVAGMLALIELSAATARSVERVGLAFAPQMVARPAGVILLVLAVATSGIALSGIRAFAVYSLVILIVAVSQFLLTHRSVAQLIKDAPPPGRTGAGLSSEESSWRIVARDLWVFTLLGMLLKHLNLLMLGVIRGPDEVALYNVSWKTSTLVGFVLLSASAVVAPRFASLHAAGDRDRLQALLRRVLHWTLWPTLVGSGLLIALRHPILSLFGATYVAGAGVLMVLVMGQLVNVAVGSAGHLLNTTGHQRSSVRIYMWCTGINLLVGFPLILVAGALGAAIADALVLACWNLLMLIVVRKTLGVDPSVLQMLRRA